jgi:hypothetical protein
MKQIVFKEELDIEFEIVNLSNIYKQHKAGMTILRNPLYSFLVLERNVPLHIVPEQ